LVFGSESTSRSDGAPHRGDRLPSSIRHAWQSSRAGPNPASAFRGRPIPRLRVERKITPAQTPGTAANVPRFPQGVHARVGLSLRGARARGFPGVAAAGGEQCGGQGGGLAERHAAASLPNTSRVSTISILIVKQKSETQRLQNVAGRKVRIFGLYTKDDLAAGRRGKGAARPVIVPEPQRGDLTKPRPTGVNPQSETFVKP